MSVLSEKQKAQVFKDFVNKFLENIQKSSTELLEKEKIDEAEIVYKCSRIKNQASFIASLFESQR